MFRRPRLRPKAICRQVKLRRVRYAREHAKTSRKHDYTVATRQCHNLSSCDKKKNRRLKSAKAPSLHRTRLQTNPITQEAMHYSIRIPSKSKLGLLHSFLHADNAYLDTQSTISQITNIYVMHRQQAQLQARTQATLEAMFNAIT